MKLAENNHQPPTHHLIIFWRSKVKGHGHTVVQVCGGEDIHVDASKSIF